MGPRPHPDALAAAAVRLGVREDTLSAWESGASLPTVRQARILAKTYRIPFSPLFLSTPRAVCSPAPRDYRRLAGAADAGPDPDILLDVRTAWFKRDTALELLRDAGASPPRFSLTTSLDVDPENAGAALRAALQVPPPAHPSWRDARRAYNTWRSASEALGVFVLQTADIPHEKLRAYSLYNEELPVIVINRKDPTTARSFSLTHELVHLALRTSGLCDLSTDAARPPEDQRLEVFCNAVAAVCLIPRGPLLAHRLVAGHSSLVWDDAAIEELARTFGVSREALLRRLLTLGRTTRSFYERRRAAYAEEYQRKRRSKGYPPPAINAVSLLGKPFVRIVLDSLAGERITSGDVADYLGVSVGQIPGLREALRGEAE